MSSAIIKYTSKLNTNLQNIKKRIGEIAKKSGEEKNRAILDLYTYFKRDTNVRVNLFTDAGETITRCLTVTECIHRDLEYLQSRCDTDLVGDERQEYCNGLVRQIGNELLGILDMVEQKAKSILDEPDIVDLFVEHLKEEKEEELEYLSRLVNGNITRDNIYSYRSEIKDKLYQCYKGRNDRDTRIKWIVYGYIFGKNRRLEDWFPSVNSRFLEYDELLDKKVVDDSTIRFSQYNKKNLNGGLTQLEDTLKKYSVDNKNYKVYNKATNKEIDFSEYRDDLHSDVSYVYRDPDTDERLLTVIAPRSKYSAVYWGWDTKWCTARIDKGENNIFMNNMFSQYYNDDDLERLYILQFKTNKYQLHFRSGQFMNVEDELAVLNSVEKLLFGKWIQHFVKDKPECVYDILKFFLKFGIPYPVDVYLKYPNSTQRVEYKKTGSYKEWYPGGQMKIETTYVDGKHHGGYNEWYPDGQIEIETTYVDGKRHGGYNEWYEDGQIQTETTYVDGKLHGGYKNWHENGQIQTETTYMDGKLHGGYKRWWENGQISIKTTYMDGKLHGNYNEWYENGQMSVKSTYKDDKVYGSTKSWYENGKLQESY